MNTPLNQIDFYKADHRSQYPKGTELVFSNFTPRSSRLDGVDEVIFFGLQYYLQHYLIDEWNDKFFNKSKDEVVNEYARRMETSGIEITYEHVADLHDLGYLPVQIWSIPEGDRVPLNVPMLVMWNTHPEFFWLTNYLETSLSAVLWGPCTSATIADRYRTLLNNAAEYTGGSLEFVDWQGHDFSMRGMFGIEAGQLSGAGHLTSFNGTDTIPAIDFLEQYYNAQGFIGGSVPATEHSVMCMGTQENEIDTYRRLVTEVYPAGVVSIVSDTWDYWNVWESILPALKEDILAREGTVTIRPDSGDPVKIICGDPDAEPGSAAFKGSFELAWEIFGGTTTSEGFRQLDSHINLIYGDSITYERCKAIVDGLITNGFVPSMIFGIGSYTYQYNTRDTFGFAMKATYGEVNGEPREIFKDPVTDSGSKKSAKGLLAVNKVHGRYELSQGVDWRAVYKSDFRPRFQNGQLYNQQTLQDIRNRVRGTV